MNIGKPHTDHPQTAFDEHEWQAQERAMHIERTGTATHDEDQTIARYRTISRALQAPPMDALPPDFAAVVARQAAARREAAEGRIERALTQILIALLGLSGGVVSVLYGATWLRAIGSALPNGSGSWIALAIAGGGVYWLLEYWQEHRAAR